MKISTLLGVCLFALMAFRPAHEISVKKQRAKLDTVYCGWISEGCNGAISVKIGFYGAGPYLIGIYDGYGNPMTVTVHSISQVSSNVFALNVTCYCNGSPINYIGNAYTVEC
jgi:hypothetical protein